MRVVGHRVEALRPTLRDVVLVGLRGKDQRWSIEFWGQNIFNQDYTQVGFNSPFQEGAAGAPFTDPQFSGGRQIFSAYLAEPRTYGVTLRTRY